MNASDWITFAVVLAGVLAIFVGAWWFGRPPDHVGKGEPPDAPDNAASRVEPFNAFGDDSDGGPRGPDRGV
jgi:hypothetical protein